MILLALFAFVAGAGTALSPCVLPILPAVLSAGVTGGRRRPLGVVIGLAVTFTFAIVGLVYVIDALGLPDDLVRTIAIVVLLGFGITLVIPPLADRIEAMISGLLPATRNRGGDGFGTGLLVGASLGIVYAPCAGPILAGIITVSAAQDFTAGKLLVAISYALGSAVVIYALLLGGRRLTDRLKPIQSKVQIGLGVVMIAVAGAMLADLDLRFQRSIAENLPGFLRNPATALEESDLISEELADVRGGPHAAAVEGGAEQAEQGLELPVLGTAPELVPGGGEWFNSEPLTIAGNVEQDRVTLIDFWTYTCINCIRTFPYLRAWDEEYRDQGLTIIGVHAPEFPFERDADNVEGAIDDYDIDYPVVQDNELGTWNAFANQYWPAKYLIDAEGNIRYAHFGEGDYETTERAIRSLLAEAGESDLGPEAQASGETIDPGTGTPETYFGGARAQGFVQRLQPGPHDYGAIDPERLGLNQFAYAGTWDVSLESAEAIDDASISLRFQARRVFVVMGSHDRGAEVEVLLDGEPISDGDAGEDVSAGAATVSSQRLYRLVDLPEAGEHSLTLRFDPGVSGYAFTFG